ncbi:putative membrane protein YccC [Methylobacterium sp. BE186]|nr:putative membrane protein YccC [Methylobacterium sp. BE186]
MSESNPRTETREERPWSAASVAEADADSGGEGMRASERRTARDVSRLGLLRDQLGRVAKRLPLRRRLSRGTAHGVMSACAAIVAYLPTQALGLREGFWSAITALAVAQTEFGATRSTARDQFTGAAIGGMIGLGTYLAAGPSLPSYALSVLLSIVACGLVNVASAGRLAAITATILLLVPHLGSVERMLWSRVFEVGWGVCVAIVTVWIVTRINRRLGIAL